MSAALGYAAAALDSAAAAKLRRQQLPAWRRQLQQRVRSLTRTVQDRRVGRRHPGEESAWIINLANLASVKFGQVKLENMLDLAAVIGLPAIDERSLAAVVGEVSGRRRRLLTAAQCGALIGLTTEERVRLGIRDIDATDESAADRKKRLARLRQARRRASGAPLRGAPRQPSVESERPWEATGVSRRTWYRNKAQARAGTADVTRPSEIDICSREDIPRARVGIAPANLSKIVTVAVPTIDAGHKLASGHSDPPTTLSWLGQQRPGMGGDPQIGRRIW